MGQNPFQTHLLVEGVPPHHILPLTPTKPLVSATPSHQNFGQIHAYDNQVCIQYTPVVVDFSVIVPVSTTDMQQTDKHIKHVTNKFNNQQSCISQQ